MPRIMKCIACALIVSIMPIFGAQAVLSVAPLVDDVPINIHCKSALLMEESSGQIIFEMNADEKRPVASVVKMMTILMCLEAIESGRISLADSVTISKNASGMGGSQVLLDTGEIQTLDILLKSAIVGSANDASVAISEHIYGSEELFVKEMNKKAEVLGMTNTHFVNCTGLPAEGQHTTARDVARMSEILFDYDLYYDFSTIWMDKVDHKDGRITDLTNTNRLIRLYDGCDGGKTGSTNEAGYCISATAKRGGMRLIAVVLGAETGSDRFDTAEKMLDYGFANYRINTVAEKGARIKGEIPVKNGQKESVPLVLNDNLTLLMNKAESADIELKPNLPEYLKAPFQKGERVGSVDVIRNGRTIAEIGVVTMEGAQRQGFSDVWRRVWREWGL
ncbi:MAG: D-alanyl-D-alanine carboxypeptidase [Clostridia bacterium]|nr:D-alanyl-D-alanine carboxypeptidase [Clostridia bacterium]MBQ4158187.1 D-alanyl-D-alanine carboxypeptidase [Clostridia bacterium]